MTGRRSAVAAVALGLAGAIVFPAPAGADLVRATLRGSTPTPAAASGASSAPPQVLWVAIPPGHRVEHVRVVPHAVRAVPGSTDAPDLASEPRARVLGVGAWHGHAIAFVEYQPVFGTAAQVRVVDGAELEIETREAGPPPVRRLRPNPELAAREADGVRRRVVNPDAVSPLAAPAAKAEPHHGAHRPASYPSLEGSDVEYVIVTPAALAPAFQALADWKTRRGVPAVVQTIESILATTRQGADLQETIRNYLQDAYTHWSVQWVLLGGDTPLIPARFLSARPIDQLYPGGATEEIPCDLYFAGLDGNWNADGDANWGEAPLSGETDPDAGDLLADIYVSRAPVETPADVDVFVQKVITYETPADPTYQGTPLFLAEVLFPVNWDSTQAIIQDGGQMSQDLINSRLPPGAFVKRRYEDYTEYPGALPISRALSLADLNTGHNLVNHVGHGFRYNMSVGDQSITNADGGALSNGNRLSVLHVLNCTSVAFDYSCLAEHLLRNPNGGMVGVLGATRSAYPLPASLYQSNYYDLLYNDGVWRLGELFSKSRLNQVGLAANEGAHRWTHYIYAMLGDPELAVYSRLPDALDVVHPISTALGTQVISVSVTSGGLPVAGARVCLQKGDDDYAVGETDGTGTAQLSFRAESGGSIDVTVSGKDLQTYIGTISVVPSGAYVHVDALSLDDDGSGGTIGNADGVIDAGERIDLLPVLRNSGAAPAALVIGVVSESDPHASVVIANVNAATVPAGGTLAAQAPVRLQVAANAPDQHAIELLFSLSNGELQWQDRVRRVVHAPVLELFELSIQDAVLGNGNGVPDEEETFDLVVTVKNYGSGAVDGMTAVLQTQSEFSVEVVQPNAAYGRVEPMASAAATFRVLTHFVDETLLDLHLSDSHARQVVLHLDLTRPAPPPAPALDPSTSPTVVLASWEPVTSNDLGGYHLYRALSAGGPWTRVTLDPTPVSYFRNVDLLTSTRYYYRVESIDTSGNRSTPSAVASVSTNPPQLSGWPIDLQAETASSPAIGDLDGDGIPEIVLGDLHVYAWHANGEEILDADNDAQTWGVFNAETDVTNASVALGELDGTPGLEVVSCNWASNHVYVLDGDGSILWTRMPNNGGVVGYWGTPTIADVDRDGFNEVFAPSKDGRLYAWNHDGTPLLPGNADGRFALMAGLSRSSPAIGNLDADGPREIVVTDVAGNLHAWNADGTPLPNFPRSWGAAFYNSPVLGDVDGDGDLEIVALSLSGANNLHVLRADGTELPGFPITVVHKAAAVSPSPALADLNADGKLEIIVVSTEPIPSESRMFVYRWNGTLYPGWPQNLGSNSESSPVVADFDGDGMPDIVHGSEAGVLRGWSAAGVELNGFPLSLGDFIRGTPMAGDVDLDGSIDLVLAGWDRSIYVWDLPAAWNADAAQWPAFLHDAARTARFAGGPDEASATLPEPPATLLLAPNRPNPFNPTTRIAFELPAAARTRLQLFDVRGRLVRDLLDARLGPGRHEVVWDGRDAAGRVLGSGVYYARLSSGDAVRMRSMLLIK